MTDKERLENIKEQYQWAVENRLANRVDDSDIEWLIQQAKRVEESEKERDEWKDTSQFYYMTNQELREQNKRYKQALEFYADKENYFLKQRMTSSFYTPIELDKGEKARQALDRDEN